MLKTMIWKYLSHLTLHICICTCTYLISNSIPPYIVVFLSLLALQVSSSYVNHLYRNIYPTLYYAISIPTYIAVFGPYLHCSFHIKNLSHFILCYFYPYLHCSFWPQNIIWHNNIKISILPYIAYLHVYI